MSRVNDLLQSIVGQECWGVHLAAASPQLLFGVSGGGTKVQGKESEFSLLIWCAWRLREGANIKVSSDTDFEGQLHTILEQLESQKVVEVELTEPTNDLRVVFDNNWCLEAFATFDSTWSLDNWQFSCPAGTFGATGSGAIEFE